MLDEYIIIIEDCHKQFISDPNQIFQKLVEKYQSLDAVKNELAETEEFPLPSAKKPTSVNTIISVKLEKLSTDLTADSKLVLRDLITAYDEECIAAQLSCESQNALWTAFFKYFPLFLEPRWQPGSYLRACWNAAQELNKNEKAGLVQLLSQEIHSRPLSSFEEIRAFANLRYSDTPDTNKIINRLLHFIEKADPLKKRLLKFVETRSDFQARRKKIWRMLVACKALGEIRNLTPTYSRQIADSLFAIMQYGHEIERTYKSKYIFEVSDAACIALAGFDEHESEHLRTIFSYIFRALLSTHSDAELNALIALNKFNQIPEFYQEPVFYNLSVHIVTTYHDDVRGMAWDMIIKLARNNQSKFKNKLISLLEQGFDRPVLYRSMQVSLEKHLPDLLKLFNDDTYIIGLLEKSATHPYRYSAHYTKSLECDVLGRVKEVSSASIPRAVTALQNILTLSPDPILEQSAQKAIQRLATPPRSDQEKRELLLKALSMQDTSWPSSESFHDIVNYDTTDISEKDMSIVIDIVLRELSYERFDIYGTYDLNQTLGGNFLAKLKNIPTNKMKDIFEFIFVKIEEGMKCSAIVLNMINQMSHWERMMLRTVFYDFFCKKVNLKEVDPDKPYTEIYGPGGSVEYTPAQDPKLATLPEIALYLEEIEQRQKMRSIFSDSSTFFSRLAVSVPLKADVSSIIESYCFESKP